MVVMEEGPVAAVMLLAVQVMTVVALWLRLRLRLRLRWRVRRVDAHRQYVVAVAKSLSAGGELYDGEVLRLVVVGPEDRSEEEQEGRHERA